MNEKIKQMLEYQKVEAEVVKLEKQLEQNPDKIQAQKMISAFKSSQQQAENLEKEAARAVEEFNKVKAIYETNEKLAQKLSSIDVDKLEDEKVDKLNKDLEDVLNNLNIVERKLMALNKNVEEILKNFEQAKKNASIAKANYTKAKTAFESVSASQNENIAKLKSILAKLAKTVDGDILKKYQALRQDKVFPVFVPLSSNLCGGCRMNLSVVDINKMKDQGYVVCENCHRIIYNA